MLEDGDIDTVTNKISFTLKKRKAYQWKIEEDDELSSEIHIGNFKKASEMSLE